MEVRGSCENAPCQRLLLQGADFIPLVLVPSRVQRLQGCMEGTVCTTIFTAFQASKQAAFPRKHITQNTFPLLLSQPVSQGTAFCL